MGVRRILIVIVNTILLLLMIALLVITIVAYTKYKDVNTVVGDYFTIAFAIVVGIIGLATLIVICGLCLSNSSSYCCCIFYCILALFFGIVFLGVGIASFVAIPIALGDTCTSHSIFVDIQNFYQLSKNSICVTCPCYFPLQVIENTYSPQQIIELTPQIPLANSIDTTLAVKAQDCFGWNNNQFVDGYKILSFLQSKFKCTGWCQNTTSLFYRFTNVSNGIPQKTCYTALKDTSRQLKNAVGIPGIILGALNILSVIIFLFICCSSSETQTPINKGNNITIINVPPQFSQQALTANPFYYNIGNRTTNGILKNATQTRFIY